jgi:hypothetical protein
MQGKEFVGGAFQAGVGLELIYDFADYRWGSVPLTGESQVWEDGDHMVRLYHTFDRDFADEDGHHVVWVRAELTYKDGTGKLIERVVSKTSGGTERVHYAEELDREDMIA